MRKVDALTQETGAVWTHKAAVLPWTVQHAWKAELGGQHPWRSPSQQLSSIFLSPSGSWIAQGVNLFAGSNTGPSRWGRLERLPSAFGAVLAIKTGFLKSHSPREMAGKDRCFSNLPPKMCHPHSALSLLPFGLFKFHNYVFNSQSNMYL